MSLLLPPLTPTVYSQHSSQGDSRGSPIVYLFCSELCITPTLFRVKTDVLTQALRDLCPIPIPLWSIHLQTHFTPATLVSLLLVKYGRHTLASCLRFGHYLSQACPSS